MKTLFSTLVRTLAPFRRTLLHVLCFSSFGAVVVGWSLVDRLGPISVIVPAVAAIGSCLSEIDRLQGPGFVRRPPKRQRRFSDRPTA